jgi:chromosome segregation ATPase
MLPVAKASVLRPTVTAMTTTDDRLSRLEARMENLETHAGPGQADAHGEVLQHSRRELAQFRDETRKAFARVDNEFAMVHAALGQIRTDVAGLKTDVAGLKTDVAGLKTGVAGLKTGVAGLETDMADVKDTLGEVLRRLPPAA